MVNNNFDMLPIKSIKGSSICCRPCPLQAVHHPGLSVGINEMFKNLTLFIFGCRETTLQRNATKYERQVDSFCRCITVWSESLKISRLLRVLVDLFHLLSSRNFCLPISRS